MSEAWVGFDLDDVIANLRHTMAQEIGKKVGKLSNWNEWHSYDFFQEHLSLKEFQTILIEGKVLERCSPEPGAREAIEQIRNSGYHVGVVTARGFHPNALSITEKWFSEHGIDVDQVFIVKEGQKKSEILRDLPKLHAYVDDYAKHLHDVNDEMSNKNLYLVDRPWNRSENQFNRILNIGEYASSILNENLPRAHRFQRP